MKLIIQIPCFNEADQLPQTLADLPRAVDGFDVVEWLVIDDGSSDATIAVAREHGVDHLVRLTNNKGLAAAFQAGIDTALKLGADVIVNTDADNQYRGADVERLVAPILEGRADMVVGDREVNHVEHFSPLKKALQRLGSWVVRQASSTSVPDTTSGFRAYNREAAIQMLVVSKLTYTLEPIIQAGKLLVAVDHVPIRTNPKTRESRLFPSMGAYVRRNTVSIFRIYAQYEPLRVFWSLALLIGLASVAVWARFAVAYAEGNGKGPVQSLILGAGLYRRPAGGAAGDDAEDLRARAAHRAPVGRGALPLRTGITRARRRPRRRARPRRGGVCPGGRPPRPLRRRRRQARRAGDGAPVSRVTVSAEGIVTGNTYDKYGSANPLVRHMMDGFHRALEELVDRAGPASLLDVGCGEGVLAQRLARRLQPRRVVGVDRQEDSIQAGWARHEA